jgi:nucleoside 2-deoxyribosyltransferase
MQSMWWVFNWRDSGKDEGGMKIYLAGLIATDYPQSIEWRKNTEDLLGPVIYHILSPMRGKENLADESGDGGITSVSMTSKDIILRDYNDVLQSDIVLVNLNTFGSPRPLLGTIYEMAWVWQLRKRCIAICDKGNYLMHEHPFMKETINHYFETLEEACRFIRKQK